MSFIGPELTSPDGASSGRASPGKTTSLMHHQRCGTQVRLTVRSRRATDGAMRGPAFFAYSDNYLIDVKFGIIMDVAAFDSVLVVWPRPNGDCDTRGFGLDRSCGK